MRKADVILCLLLALLAAAGFFYTQNNTAGTVLNVKVSGQTVVNKPLAALPADLSIATSAGAIHLQCSANSVSVINAPCPDKLCQKQGAITAAGQVIVCVPCQTVITLSGTETNHDYDAVLQ